MTHTQMVTYVSLYVARVVRQLWSMWTNGRNHAVGRPYHITPQCVALINSRIRTIRSPQEIHCLPRDISAAKWKAAEWKNWLLYYAVPCLLGILDHRYMEHLSVVVVAVYLVLQETISADELLAAEDHITAFITAVTPLHGEKAMTFNMHSLLHLVDSVRKTGPLWATSAFPFESEVYTVKQEIKGPVNVAVQIAKNMVAVNICKATVAFTQRLTASCKAYCRTIISTVRLHQR